jgi:membrane protease subunit HflK
MGWNDDSDDKGPKNPWQQKPSGSKNSQDLDSFVKEWQEKLNKILSGRPPKTPFSAKPNADPKKVLGLLLFAVVFVGILLGFYRVEEAEQALVLRFGKYDRISPPGLHWRPVIIDQVQKVNALRMNSIKHEATILTKDANLVFVQLVVQYQVNDPKSYFLKMQDPMNSLKQATESALRHVVGDTLMGSVITEGREIIAIDVMQKIQSQMARYQAGILITKVNIEDAHPPSAVKDAFDDVVKAKEDEQRLKNEAEAYANGVIPEARGRAQRQLSEALGHRDSVIAQAKGEADRFKQLLVEYQKSPKVLTDRLYLETMAEIYKNNPKVLLNVSSSNPMLYLPIDQLMKNKTLDNPLNGQAKVNK